MENSICRGGGIYASHPMKTMKPKHFIISVYSIEVKWLADQYFMQDILVFGKGGNELGKGGTDPNILLFQI